MNVSEPVIVHSSFEGSEIKRLLGKFYKVRVVEGTESHSIIFPKTKNAFLIQPLCELTEKWPPTEKDLDKDAVERCNLVHGIPIGARVTLFLAAVSDIDIVWLNSKRVKKFARIHRNAFVFLTAGQMSQAECLLFMEIQKELASENLTLHPACSAAQCITIINDIVQPKTSVKDLLIAKELIEGNVTEEFNISLLSNNLKITSHDAMVLLDGCQTLSNIACAQMEQLLECSLSVHTAKIVQSFFQ